MLRRLPAWGVDSIALVPFGFVRRAPLRIVANPPGSWENDAGIEALANEAHRLGMKVLLKPHLWRVRDSDAATPEDRRDWFEQYAPFIEHNARLAARVRADLFSIGVEYQAFTKEDKPWREIVARVRRIVPGPLVYSANHGDEFENIAFWDALDYIGLDNYYPLPDDYSVAAVVSRIDAVHRRFGKPVLFTEAGFPSVAGARKAPWEDEVDKPLSLDEQARCYEAILAGFAGKPWFHGVYWWKVGSNGYGGAGNRSMTPWGKPAMDVVKRWYLGPRK